MTAKGRIALLVPLVFLIFGSMSMPRLRAQTLDQVDLTNQVRKALVTLPYYGLFDNLEFTINGSTVVLEGQVVRAITKSDAQHRVAKIKGVETVVNNIKVLPLFTSDKVLRRALARAIFSSGSLYRYRLGVNPSIHIIVDSGHVTLVGVVDSEADKNLAGIRANSVSGVFSVENKLRVQGNQ